MAYRLHVASIHALPGGAVGDPCTHATEISSLTVAPLARATRLSTDK
jgi:hypothetical protein